MFPKFQDFVRIFLKRKGVPFGDASAGGKEVSEKEVVLRFYMTSESKFCYRKN